MFLTFASLSTKAGHLARFLEELPELSKLNEISIVCLGKDPDDESTKNRYRKASFFYFPAKFDGWRVVNLAEIVERIEAVIIEVHPDLVILQMEVWDLMRELGMSLKNKVVFATVVHAMPFLAAPINPSGNFENDIIEHVGRDIEKFNVFLKNISF